MSSIKTPWSSVGYLVMKRTYARRLNENDKDSPTEEWIDIVLRVIEACRTQLKVGFTMAEEGRLFDYMMKLKGTVAGRFLWQLGTSTVDRLGLPSLQNCAFTTIDHPIRPFVWAFSMLMLGAGVGYNLQREFVYKLPPVKENFAAPKRKDEAGADFIVPDSREGWEKLLTLVLDSAFYQDQIHPGFSYSTQVIRGKGTPIRGFGGVASGPEDLCEGIEDISKVLLDRTGKQLRPIDCLDIMNILGRVVVSGNVRRCLPGETEVQTGENSWKHISDISENDQIYIDGETFPIKNKFEQGEQEVFKIIMEDGTFLESTANHRWYVFDSIDQDMKWVETQNLMDYHFMVDPN